jgi:hypothetical protein
MIRLIKDEAHILAICDKLLGPSLRQHRFDFLVGRPSLKTGRSQRLPVDAYYPSRKLVIEYHERQHTGPVPFFDRRVTACGLTRDKQRREYDQRRRELIPQHGLNLVILDYSQFDVDSRGRIRRGRDEEARIRTALAAFLNQTSSKLKGSTPNEPAPTPRRKAAKK